MEFYMNGEKIDVMLEEEKTVGDVLKSFEITCEENQAAVIGIKIDGKNITADEFDAVSKNALSENSKFEFTVVTKQNIKDSFTTLTGLFKELAEKMRQVPVELQSGKSRQAHESIKNLADSINDFCHVAALASLFEEYNSFAIDGKLFPDFFADFSPILSDFEQALKANDTVSVGDLAEYEICPRLEAIANTLEGIA